MFFPLFVSLLHHTAGTEFFPRQFQVTVITTGIDSIPCNARIEVLYTN